MTRERENSGTEVEGEWPVMTSISKKGLLRYQQDRAAKIGAEKRPLNFVKFWEILIFPGKL